MILQVIAVKDVAVAGFMKPVFVRHRGEALRMFMDEVRRADAQNVMNGHPQDFELWHLGSFDDDTGLFHVLPHGIERIATGVDVRLTD